MVHLLGLLFSGFCLLGKKIATGWSEVGGSLPGPNGQARPVPEDLLWVDGGRAEAGSADAGSSLGPHLLPGHAGLSLSLLVTGSSLVLPITLHSLYVSFPWCHLQPGRRWPPSLVPTVVLTPSLSARQRTCLLHRVNRCLT